MSQVITQEQVYNYSQKSEVEDRIKSYLDFVTGSAGGWPTDSRAGLLFGIDFTIQSGSDEVKFFESNTNLYSAQIQSVHSDFIPQIARYASSQSFDNVIIYGSVPGDRPYNGYLNPPTSQRPYISASFAEQNISCSFNDTTDRQYISMRGSSSFDNTFHFFHSNPEHTDDSLHEMVSGSYDKRKFKESLSLSPVSSSVISNWVSSSKTPNTGVEDWPDYINKNAIGDASFQVKMGGSIYINTYRSDLEPMASESYSTWWQGENSYNEEFIISSGSYYNGKRYSATGRALAFSTPERNEIIFSQYNPRHSELIKPEDRNDGWGVWRLNPYHGYSSISGSLIRMFDGSTKQIQDIEVGDIVKSYQPAGMPNSDIDFLNYSVSDLTGSYATGSIVVGTDVNPTRHYYVVSGSDNNEYTIHQLGTVFVYDSGSSDYRFKLGWELDSGDRLFDKDTNEIEIVSITDNFMGSEADFYSLNVEDIDTYFTSDILVHNLPRK